jgi:hypothetical protein
MTREAELEEEKERQRQQQEAHSAHVNQTSLNITIPGNTSTGPSEQLRINGQPFNINITVNIDHSGKISQNSTSNTTSVNPEIKVNTINSTDSRNDTGIDAVANVTAPTPIQ